MPNNQSNDDLVAFMERTDKMLDYLTKENKDKKNSNSHNVWFKIIGPAITVAVLATGIIGSWYSNKESVSTLKIDYSKLENKVSKLEDSSHDIELKVVEEKSDLASVKENLQEVKQDVKYIKNKLMGN